MFDVTSRVTYMNIPNWYRDVARVCGDTIYTPATPVEPPTTQAEIIDDQNPSEDNASQTETPEEPASYSVLTIPAVLVGNKVDVRDRKVVPKVITFHRKKNLQYYDISSKSNYNFEKPFLWLMRKLVKYVSFWKSDFHFFILLIGEFRSFFFFFFFWFRI